MGLMDALQDPLFWRDVRRNAKDLGQSASNAALSNVTGPVDMANSLLGLLGIKSAEPVGGARWAERVGLSKPVGTGLPQVVGETLGLVAPFAGARAPQVANKLLEYTDNVMAPSAANQAARNQLGMIQTPLGRIPETLDERMALRKLLERNALSSGYEVSSDAATSGASLYSSIVNPKNGKEAIVRISDHTPRSKYVPGNTPYFSVLPDQGTKKNGGTFEQAVSWLWQNGLPIKNIGPRYENMLLTAKKQQEEIAEASQKAYANALAAKQQKIQTAIESGQKYVIDSTKINSGGRRYDITLPDGKKLTAYSRDLPESIKAGSRDNLVAYILERNGMAP